MAVDDRVRELALVYRTDENGFTMKCGDEAYCWREMVTNHWPNLFNYYNTSLQNRSV